MKSAPLKVEKKSTETSNNNINNVETKSKEVNKYKSVELTNNHCGKKDDENNNDNNNNNVKMSQNQINNGIKAKSIKLEFDKKLIANEKKKSIAIKIQNKK